MTIDFKPGDTIKVYQKIREGDPSVSSGQAPSAGSGQVKTRLQVFEGVVLSIDNNAKSFTVRKDSDGIGVERIWSFDTPWIEKIEVKKKAAKIRRAKLYYLRGLSSKEIARVVA